MGLTEKLDRAIEKAEEVKEEIESNPFSRKSLIIGGATALAVYGIGHLVRELLAKQVKGIIGYMEIHRLKAYFFRNGELIDYSTFERAVLDQSATKLILYPGAPSPEPGMTIGEYIEKHPHVNVTYPLPEGYSLSGSGPMTLEKRIPIYGIVKKYPFSHLSLLGASVASGILGGIMYSLKGIRSLFHEK
jgi:hypothetical protein